MEKAEIAGEKENLENKNKELEEQVLQTQDMADIVS